jgi:cytoskeleton protein RodZ
VGYYGNEVEAVGAFGERLRREREMRGISLDEIVATTKIGTRLLRALENEQFDLLPGGIFNKSYVRAYAKCVGMDEEEAVAAYMEAANEAPPDNRVIAHQASFHSDRLPEEPTGFPIVPVLILLVVIVGGISGWKVYRDHLRDREVRAITGDAAVPAASTPIPDAGNSTPQFPAAPTTAPPSNAGVTAQRVAPVSGEPATKPTQNSASSTASAAAAPANPAAGTPFEVVIRPKDSAWVSIKSDGKFVVRGIIRPPDVKTIRATSQVVFWTGNAGAVEVSFNGKSVPLPGDANQEGELVFDSRGVMRHPAAVAAQ